MQASLPEPPPQPHGIDVTAQLLGAMEHTPLRSLIEARRAYGMSKYGQSLMSQDGRNGLEDARQELGDLVQYVYKVFGPGMSEQHTNQEFLEFIRIWEEAKQFIDQTMNIK
jgi:hypothetical protein